MSEKIKNKEIPRVNKRENRKRTPRKSVRWLRQRITKKRTYNFLLLILIIIAAFLRLSIAFQTETPSYDSYFSMIEVKAIKETGLPRFYSLGGNKYYFSPGYYYFLTLFSFMPLEWVMKIVPNILLILVIPLIYEITYNLTKNYHVSFAAAFFSAFAPALFSTYLNESKPTTLAMLLILLIIRELTKSATSIKEQKIRLTNTVILSILLVITSQLAWIILGAYLIYQLMLRLEDLESETLVKDLSIFTFILLFWYTMIMFKEVLFTKGSELIWKSISPNILGAFFSDLTYLSLIYAVGVVPIFLGMIAIYNILFEQRIKKVYLIISLGLATIIATLTKSITINISILLLSTTFILLAGNGLKNIYNYLRKTKIDYLTIPFIIVLVILFLLTSFFPAVISGITEKVGPNKYEVGATNWLRVNTPENSTIAASPKEGFLIEYNGERPVLVDDNYLSLKDDPELMSDLRRLYTTRFTTQAVEITDKYSIDYVYLGPGSNAEYDILGVIMNDRCFERVFNNGVVNIFKVRCHINSLE